MHHKSRTEAKQSTAADVVVVIIVVVIFVVGVIKAACEKHIVAYVVGGRTDFVVGSQAFLQQLFELFVFGYELYVLGLVVFKRMVQRWLALEYREADCHFVLYFVERFHARAELEQYAAEGPYICCKAQYSV